MVVVAAAAAAAVDGWPAKFLKCHVKLLIHVQAALKVFRQCCYFDSKLWTRLFVTLSEEEVSFDNI